MKIVLCVLTLFVLGCLGGTDFYQLLGVTKSATTKEIRKAFKKIALRKHPDKNVDNPKAHEEFVIINRAYETLKDDDLRKKYDMYGEEGLKDDFRGGRQYESWKYYQEEFGLYDDDPEIITLSHHDYEISVEGTSDIWFINFYSPHCSHCHTLAPTWREVARELEGVIRIGAVNCGDDWQLCRSIGVRSYPTLLLYPQREKYYGERTTRDLVEFAMKEVSGQVHTIWEGTYRSVVTEQSDLPWLITFCGDGGDCLSEKAALKVAVMLDGLCRVGVVSCHSDEKICEKLDIEHGTYYFPKDNVTKGVGLHVESLYPKDIARVVLEQLPDVTVLDKHHFVEIIDALKTDEEADAWLIHFVEGGASDLELRKLPAMLESIQIGRVDCSLMRTVCNDRHIVKFPSFVIYKPGGRHEVYYGRLTAHDVAAFAKDSILTPMEALGPGDFPGRVIDSQEHWFVDFFAPWCPPCMKLLPEFRKAAKDMGNMVNFGTVDCTIHSTLCRRYQINSYPTTIFYNRSEPHRYQGHHDASHIAEFLQDTMSPPVTILNPTTFNNVINKGEDEIWMVDFFAPWCGPCQQLAPEWRRLAKMLNGVKNVHVAQVDCQAHRSLCQIQGVQSYPSVWLYPTGQYPRPLPYQGWHRDAHSLRAWAYEYLPSKVETLNWNRFERDILHGEDAWIVDFYTPWCGHCQVFKPEFEKVAEELEGVAKAGKVDCDSSPNICRRANIHAYPTVRLYPGTKVVGGTEQNAYGWDVNSQNADEIIQFVRDNTPNKQQKIPHDEF